MDPNLDESGMEEFPPAARACDACRRMKIRCINKENPPCRRCKQQKLECTFEMGVRQPTRSSEGSGSELARSHSSQFDPSRTNAGQSSDRRVRHVEQRLEEISRHVENRVAGLDNKLDRLFKLFDGQNGSDPHSWHLPDAPRAGSHAPPAALSSVSPQSSLPPVPHYNSPGRPSSGMARLPNLPLAQKRANDTPASDHSASPRTGHQDEPLRPMTDMNPFRPMKRHFDHVEQFTHPSSVVDKSPFRLSRRTGSISATTPESASWNPPRDPIQGGYCSESTARELFKSFFMYAHPFIPVFDPEYDTFESLSSRCGLCLTVILYIAAAVNAVRGQANEAQTLGNLAERCRVLAEEAVKSSLVASDHSFEHLQGIVVFASWIDDPWRIGCHAAAIAIDMRLHLTARHTLTGDIPPSKASNPPKDLHAVRAWLAIVKLVYEMSFNNGQPLIFASTILSMDTLLPRRLLKFPTSNIYDSRCIVSVELLQARESLYHSLLASLYSEMPDLDARLQMVNDTIRDRKQFWDRYYRSMGLAADHFLVKELYSQAAYAIMYANSCAWVGIHSRSDMDRLSRERKQLLAAAMRSAAYLVQSIGHGSQTENSEYGNRYFQLGIVSTARYLIRMCELLPEICDLYQVSDDLEHLMRKLPHYSVSPLASELAGALRTARQSGVLPPPVSDVQQSISLGSLAGSQQQGSVTLETLDTLDDPAGQLDMQLLNQLFPTSVTKTLLENGPSQDGSFNWQTADWTDFSTTLPWLGDLENNS